MKEKRAFGERFKSDPITHILAVLALIVGLMFIFCQGSKLVRPEAADAEMLTHAIGMFDWGFAWADALIPGPMLLIGAVCLLWGRYPFGHLLAFGGWAINFYDMIVFFAGLRALGEPLVGSGLVEVVVTALVSLLCMIWSGVGIVRECSDHK